MAHLRRRHARRGLSDHGPRTIGPARGRRAGRLSVDADARRVRRGDRHGRRASSRDPATRPLTPRPGHRDHAIRRRHRSAVPTARTAVIADRQLHRVRRAPPNRARHPRLARQADGHPRDLAVDRPDRRPHGPTGRGSRRRVREFRVGSDEFASLRRGEAIIYTTLGPEPERAHLLARLPDGQPPRIDGDRHAAEIPVHPEETLPIAVDHTQPPSIGDVDADANDI